MTPKTKTPRQTRHKSSCVTTFPDTCTLAEAAPLLGVHVSTLWRLVQRHGLGRRSGATWLLTRAELQQLVRLPRRKAGCPQMVAGNQLWKRRRLKKLVQKPHK